VGCTTHAFARGGSQYETVGSEGRIRIDTNAGNITASPLATTNLLTDAPLPPNPPFLKVVSIDGVPVPASPKFDYASPDVLMNKTTPVPIVLEANNIPVGTPITVFLTTDTGTDITASVTLAGTLATSTATVTVTLPLGTARLFARAVW